MYQLETMTRLGLVERPPVVELRRMGTPAYGSCGGCGATLEADEEYLYDNGFLMCEGCLDVEYPEGPED